MKNLIACLLMLGLWMASPAHATTIDVREHIDVTGIAEVKVVPNEFVLRATIQTFDSKLDKAAKVNETSVRSIFEAITKLGVARRYVVADDVNVNKVTEGYRERGTFRVRGYNVSRSVLVILHDPKRIEPAMKTLFRLGVDRLSMQRGHTEMERHQEAAQLQAIQHARKKAKALAKALGRKLGAAIAITEQRAGSTRSPSNFVYKASTPNLGDALSLGKITVQAGIQVKFLMK